MKSLLRLYVLLSFLICLPALSYAQMTDGQILNYVKSAKSSGKSVSAISQELLSKGVNPSQVEGLVSKSGSQKKGASVTEQALSGGSIGRRSSADVLGTDTIESEDSTTVAAVAEPVQAETRATTIFGHDIFSKSSLTFEPNENAATPQNYQLGPGDQLQIDIWGDNESSEVYDVTPEGRIFISQVGPVQLSGLTISEATARIKRLLKTKYANLGDGSSVSISLTQIRTIQVNIIGEVTTPGSYRLSSFSTVFNALYRAGGVNENGSLRAIKVIRDGKEIAKVDVYGYLLDGKSESDISLKEGDMIIVPPYVNIVEVTGKVKRPMKYELLENENLTQLFNYAGGFTGDADRKDFCVVRHTKYEKEVATVAEANASSFVLADGDSVSVSSSIDRFSNKIEVRGCVFRPGSYELGGGIATVRQLVSQAGGVMEDAFLNRAVILREKSDLNLETVSIDLKKVLSESGEDVLLKKNDVLIVSSIHELEDRGTITILGEVANPGEFTFSENTTVEDVILQAGGLLDGASMARVDVVRRVSDPNSLNVSEIISESYSFAIKDGFVVDNNNFYLKPYDIISVRRSPSYTEQRFVTISGEVAFPGEYALTGRNERLTDLVKRAGGLTQFAYVDGARILRKNDTEDNFLNGAIQNVLSKGFTQDTSAVTSLTSTSYIVATSLSKALASPGSDNDIVLQEGDIVVIPEFINTVRIDGEVMFPTALVYQRGRTVMQYINNAGGFTQRSKRNRVYVVFADGHAERGHRAGTNVEPGSVIIVPNNNRKNAFNANEVLSAASTATSLVTMMATVINLINRL